MILHLPEAHALVAKQDLPIPAWLFAWAASIVLIASFFALAAAWRKPQFEEERWRPSAAWLTAVLRSWPLQVLCGGLGVLLLGVGIYSGIHGTEAPDRNFAITFFFVTVWIGFPFASALLGNVFPIFNPWRAIARVAGGAYGLVARRRLAAPRLPGEAGTLARRRRPARLRLARGRLRLERRRRRRPRTARRGRRRLRLQRLHAGDDGPLRHRDLVLARGDLLGLLRDVLPARPVRGEGRPHRPPPPARRRDPLGDDRPRLDRGGDRLDRLDQLRRGRGRRLQTGPRPRRRLDRRARRRAAGDDPHHRLALHGGDGARRRRRLPARGEGDALGPRRARLPHAVPRLRPLA